MILFGRSLPLEVMVFETGHYGHQPSLRHNPHRLHKAALRCCKEVSPLLHAVVLDRHYYPLLFSKQHRFQAVSEILLCTFGTRIWYQQVPDASIMSLRR